MKSDSPTRLTSLEERQRFFDETRERILQHSRLDSQGDAIGQFVREHQERFAALTASIRGDSTSTTTSTSEAEIGKQQPQLRPHAPLTRSETVTQLEETSAADLVASILNGSDLSKKHLRKSSSSSKLGSESKIIRTIEIKREDSDFVKLHRSNSGGSDSSSGFGSLNNNQQPTLANSSSSAEIIKKLEPVNPMTTSSTATTKLQLLQERRNRALDLNRSEHHPSFANHFGFAARYAHFNRNNLLHKRIMNGSSITNVTNASSSKVAVTKSKSSLEYSKDSQTYR